LSCVIGGVTSRTRIGREHIARRAGMMRAMRLPSLPERAQLGGTAAAAGELPLWPPLLATRGPGARSAPHAHHAMHFVLAVRGTLRVGVPGSRTDRTGPEQPGSLASLGPGARTDRTGPEQPGSLASLGPGWQEAAGVLTAPDARHEVDASGVEVLLVFLDPESEVGAALAASLPGPVRLIAERERAALLAGADPHALLRADGADWTHRALHTLAGGAHQASQPRRVHPRVRRLLRLLRATDPGDETAETSLEALARAVDLSPGRLMHAFTESLGIPLRPYLAWLRLQRAAGAIVSGRPLADAAHAAGFADAAHMTRTFRRMFGVPPSALRPPSR
jgi:AraC-like DNA-binding protein